MQACILRALEAGQPLAGPGAGQASLFNLERYDSKRTLVRGDASRSFWFKAGQGNEENSQVFCKEEEKGRKAEGK